jgi:hypothetical protein
MNHRFLMHELNHTCLLVDIPAIGLPNEILPVEGKVQNVPTFRFMSWDHAKKYLQGLGAKTKPIEATEESLKRTSVGILTIV